MPVLRIIHRKRYSHTRAKREHMNLAEETDRESMDIVLVVRGVNSVARRIELSKSKPDTLSGKQHIIVQRWRPIEGKM